MSMPPYEITIFILFIAIVFGWNFDIFLRDAKTDGTGNVFARFLTIGVVLGIAGVIMALAGEWRLK